jgi:hypothetical protein
MILCIPWCWIKKSSENYIEMHSWMILLFFIIFTLCFSLELLACLLAMSDSPHLSRCCCCCYLKLSLNPESLLRFSLVLIIIKVKTTLWRLCNCNREQKKKSDIFFLHYLRFLFCRVRVTSIKNLQANFSSSTCIEIVMFFLMRMEK